MNGLVNVFIVVSFFFITVMSSDGVFFLDNCSVTVIFTLQIRSQGQQTLRFRPLLEQVQVALLL